MKFGTRQADGKVKYESDVVLGERYRDEQTGIEGTATQIYFYQHACERVCLELVVKGEVKEYVFDSPRLVHIASGVQATTERTGGPGDGVTGGNLASRAAPTR